MTTRFDSKRVVFYVKMILWGGDKLRASFFVNFALDLRGCLMQLHSIFTLGVGGGFCGLRLYPLYRIRIMPRPGSSIINNIPLFIFFN